MEFPSLLALGDLDALIKLVIAKLAGIIVLSIAFVMALPCAWLIVRKVFPDRSRKKKFMFGCLLTPVLTLLFSVVIVWLVVKAIENVPTVSCEDNMAMIAIASRDWAAGNDGNLPPSLAVLSNHLSRSYELFCPKSGWVPTNGSVWTNSSYVLLRRGQKATNTNVVFLRCKIHQHGVYIDGRYAPTNIIAR